MEAPRLGVTSALQLPAYTIATATPDPGRVWDLHHSSRQRQILNPLSKARDRTCNLMVPSRIRFHCAKMGTPSTVVVPPLPGKAFLRQLPFRGDDGIFDDNFIEERKQGLEQFINKVAGHPLAQNERCLHMFLQDEIIDKSYTPSKIRHA
uniref:Sorting nexin 3 n=1 Tax=Sus scrofa TaxID=9823 RepID=A0A8D1ANJ4_PIG